MGCCIYQVTQESDTTATTSGTAAAAVCSYTFLLCMHISTNDVLFGSSCFKTLYSMHPVCVATLGCMSHPATFLVVFAQYCTLGIISTLRGLYL